MGTVLRLLPKTDYSFAQAALPNNQVAIITIARRVDCSNYREAVGLLRLHAQTGFAASGKVELWWGTEGYTDEDPAAIWAPVTTPTMFVTMTPAASSGPLVERGSPTAPFGPLIFVQLRIQQNAAAAALTLSVSADLNLKS